jgi:hypothetical protein
MTVLILGKVRLNTPAIRQSLSERCSTEHTEEVVDEDDPRHSLFSVDIIKDLGRVLECDWSFSHRIGDCE